MEGSHSFFSSGPVLSQLNKKSMASIPALVSHQSPHQLETNMMKSVKDIAQTSHLNTIPSNYAYYSNNDHGSKPDYDSLPIIDFSFLTSKDIQQRSKAIHDLGQACEHWGFFVLTNHGIPEILMKRTIDACDEFFDMEEEVKRECKGSDLRDIIYGSGTSPNISINGIVFWRDFLKVVVHPHFHRPTKPQALSEVLLEYSQRNRAVVMELFRGISETLGLEKDEMQNELDLDSGFQLFAANYYPACPEPENAIGLPPHSDHGLLTFLIDNGIEGLEIQHDGKWIQMNSVVPNAILVNVGDQLEAFSNGKYKSVFHRAMLNNKETRLSLVLANGPPLETIVKPATKLTYPTTTCPPAYFPISYKDYIELLQTNQLKSQRIN